MLVATNPSGRLEVAVIATRAHMPNKTEAAVIQRKSRVGSSLDAAEHEPRERVPAGVYRVLSSPGKPLALALQHDMAQRFGQDFGRVRLHAGAAAEQSAREIGARAYTVGTHIVFGAGQNSPNTSEARNLLAHELTHVIQQSRPDGTRPRLQRAPTRIYGGDGSSGTVELFFYGDLEAWPQDRAFESPRRYPRLTGYGLGTTQEEASRYTGTAVRSSVAYKYRLTVDAKYFETNFVEGGTRFGYSEYSTKDRIPRLYFEYVGTLTGPSAPVPLRPAPPVVPGGGAGPAGKRRTQTVEGPPTLAPVEPPARTVQGEISGPKPVPPTSTGGGGGPGGPGGPPPARVTASLGGPVAPITMPEPAARLNTVTGAASAVGVQLVAAQLSALRGAEVSAALKKLEELTPTIQAYREQGYGVSVTLVVEAPKQVDIAAQWAHIGDPGQVVYFKRMYISSVSKPATVEQKYPVVRENLAPGDPQQRDPHELTLQQQIAVQMGEKYPVPGTGPRPGFQFLTGQLNLPALTGSGAAQRTEQPAQRNNLRGIAGTYRPKYERVFTGGVWNIQPLIARQLQVELDASGNPQPKMWRLGGTTQLYSYRPFALRGVMVMGGQFSAGSGLPPAADWLWNMMEYPREGLILEWVRRLDSGLREISDALISWHKI